MFRAFLQESCAGGKESAQKQIRHIRYDNSFVRENNVGTNVGIKHGTNEERLLSLINADNTITAGKAAATLTISQRQAERLFANLKQKGIIKRTGSNKNGVWIVIATSIKNNQY